MLVSDRCTFTKASAWRLYEKLVTSGALRLSQFSVPTAWVLAISRAYAKYIFT